MPCDVLIPIVWLPGWGDHIVWGGELAFHLALCSGLLHVVIVQYLLTPNDNLRAEFPEDGASGDDADSPALV